MKELNISEVINVVGPTDFYINSMTQGMMSKYTYEKIFGVTLFSIYFKGCEKYFFIPY